MGEGRWAAWCVVTLGEAVPLDLGKGWPPVLKDRSPAWQGLSGASMMGMSEGSGGSSDPQPTRVLWILSGCSSISCMKNK